MANISIIDYGCGNFRSVMQAFDYLGHNVCVCDKAEQVGFADYLVLPGVGAFGNASVTLRKSGFDSTIVEHIKNGKPFLGICVGMQILMDTGFEFGEHKGLGLVGGDAEDLIKVDQNSRSPNIGWSQVTISDNSYFKQYNLDGEYFYFNNSFVCLPENDALVSAHTSGAWAAMIEKDNMVGVQYHPEKSHVAGLRFLSAFAEMK